MQKVGNQITIQFPTDIRMNLDYQNNTSVRNKSSYDATHLLFLWGCKIVDSRLGCSIILNACEGIPIGFQYAVLVH